MQNPKSNLSRRDFIGTSAFFVLGLTGLSAVLSACGSASNEGGTATAPSTPNAGGNCASDGTSIGIQLIHTPNHTLTIPAADVIAGVQKTYTLADNGSNHTHQVTLTAADFAQLRANQGIQETSTLTGHQHVVTVNCA